MSRKMVKWISSSLVAMGAFVIGCSESNTTEPQALVTKSVNVKNDATNMWARINESGSIADYFDSRSKEGDAPIIGATTRSNVQCKAPALQMDDNTRYLDELESLFEEGELVDGVCGKALKLNDGQVAPLGVNLIDSMSVGTVEFWFRPNADFYDKSARTLMGNDGARIHFFYKDGELFFQKNHHNQHFFVNGEVQFNDDDWNLIAGQWGDGYMSLWVNGKLVAKVKHDKGYAPANRGKAFENLIVMGYKSSCCMEGPGQYSAMTTSGSFDQFRISNIPRYKIDETVDSLTDDTAACAATSLKMDEKTLYLEELETDFEAGQHVKGVCGKGLSLSAGESVTLGINLVDSMAAGTAEFWFRPNADFYDEPRTLFGNDGARLHFFYKNGELYFQKNHHNLHYYARGKVTFKNDWNLIAGQWGDGYMSIWVNGEMVALLKHDLGYVPANRGIDFENLLKIGYKSACCMPMGNSAMSTSGAYDQIRISTSPRYKVIDKIDIEDTVLPIDTLANKDDIALKDSLKKELADKPNVTIETVNGDSLKAVEKTTLLKDSMAYDSLVWVKVEVTCCRNSEDIVKKEIKYSLVATPAKD